jgi:site-specific DNA recombinase
VFETYASGHYGLAAISKSLEARGVLTRMGKPHWDREHMRKMLHNETYAGTRYYNRMTTVKEGLGDSRSKRGRWVERDRTQWIAVSVPAIVSQELFDKVQERLKHNTQRYRQPDTRYLLSGLVSCGECGHAYSSYRRYVKTARAGGRLAVYHRAGYRCNWRAAEAQHDVTRIERCRNSEIATHPSKAGSSTSSGM